MIKELKSYRGLKHLKIALNEDIENKDKTKDKLIEIQGQINKIEAFINTQDQYLQDILREHYIQGKTWKRTAIKVTGSDKNTEAIKKLVYRHLKKYEKQNTTKSRSERDT